MLERGLLLSHIGLVLVTCTVGCSLLFEESAQPVVEDAAALFDGAAEVTDAPPPGCETLPIIEDFTPPTLDCGETQFQLPEISVIDGAASCPVSTLRWTITRQDVGPGTRVLTAEGPPATAIFDINAPDPRVIAGTYGRPTFNLTLYEGPTLAEVFLDNVADGANQIFQDLADLGNTKFRLRVAAATENGQGLLVRLFDGSSGSGNPAYGVANVCLGDVNGTCKTTAGVMKATIFDFMPGQIASNARFRFNLGAAGKYWLDAVSIKNVGTGAEEISDGSFPTGQIAWTPSCNGGCTLTVIPIPPFLAEYATYTIALEAINEGGVASAPYSFDLVHEPCSPPAAQ